MMRYFIAAAGLMFAFGAPRVFAQQPGDVVPESALQGPDFSLSPGPKSVSGSDEATAAYIRGLQQILPSHGYASGPVTGTLDDMTRRGILAYQHDAGLREGVGDAAVLKETLDSVTFVRPGTYRSAQRPLPSAPPPMLAPPSAINQARAMPTTGESRVRAAQEGLKAKGYDIDVTGQLDVYTVNAIKIFEKANNLPPDGEISDGLLKKLVH